MESSFTILKENKDGFAVTVQVRSGSDGSMWLSDRVREMESSAPLGRLVTAEVIYKLDRDKARRLYAEMTEEILPDAGMKLALFFVYAFEESKLAMSNPQQYFINWCLSYGVKPAREEAVGYA